jgi:hypothetical protein
MTKPNQTKPAIAPIGCMISQRITSALTNHFIKSDNHSYKTLSDIVYGEISDIANEQKIGDWIETANGSTYRLESKPNKIS